jgi:hypothetical protein
MIVRWAGERLPTNRETAFVTPRPRGVNSGPRVSNREEAELSQQPIADNVIAARPQEAIALAERGLTLFDQRPQTDRPISEVQGDTSVHDEEEPVYYTARHLLEALNGLDARLLDLPLVLVHGKELHKPNLVNGIIPAPIPVNRSVVETKKPSLLAFAEWLDPADPS